MAIENKELLEKAEKLELDSNKYETEDELKSAIDEKEEEIAEKEKGSVNWEDKAKHLEEEAKKAFAARDTAKQERRKLQNELKAVKEKLEGAPSSEDLDGLTKELKELKKYKKELDEAKEAEELKNKSDLEKAEIRHQKELDEKISEFKESMSKKFGDLTKKDEERDKLLAEKEKEVVLLRQARLERELLEAAMNSNAYKPPQIVNLLRDEFTFDPDLGDNGRFVKHVTDAKGRLTDEVEVADRVAEFLKDPDNDNLVKSDANLGGTGHREQNAAAGGKQKKFFGTRRKEGEYDPKDPALQAEAEEKGLDVEDHIDILKLRDAKKAKIQENAEKQ